MAWSCACMDCASCCSRAESVRDRIPAWFAAVLLALAAPFVRAETVHRYDVKVAADLGRLDVRACFAGTMPAHLVATAPQAARFLRDPQRFTGGSSHALEVDAQGIVLGGMSANDCINYGVDLAAAVNAELGRFAQRWEGGATWSPERWLWRPEPAQPDDDIEVSFDLPKGVAVSAPWQPVAQRDAKPVFRVGHTPPDWPGIVAFGRFRIDEIAVPGAVLRVAL